MKTVIYLDTLLLVNFLIAYFMLMAVGLLTNQRAGFGRMVASSALAALSALILFAPELPYAGQVGYKLLSAGAITAAAFGWRAKRRYLAAVSWYAALNILLAGLVILAIHTSGTALLQTGNLAVYLRVSPLLLLGLAALCSAGVALLLRFMQPVEAPPQTVGVECELCGATVRLRAVLDTGCHLKDPVTCLPVLLVSYPCARSRLPAAVRGFLDAWFAGEGQPTPPDRAQLRLIPCNTAADKALLPGFAVADIGLITANGVQGLGRTALAFSPQSFAGGSYEALYGNDFLSY